MAATKHQLQHMLPVLADFCDEYDQEIDKCTVVVFGKRKYQGSHVWAARDKDGRGRQQMPVAEEFKLLAVVFYAQKEYQHVAMPSTAGSWAMWAAMINRCASCNLHRWSKRVHLLGA